MAAVKTVRFHCQGCSEVDVKGYCDVVVAYQFGRAQDIAKPECPYGLATPVWEVTENAE